MNDSVAAIQAAWERSTGGEWRYDQFDEYVHSDIGQTICEVGETHMIDLDGFFITTAHNHWPDVMAYIRQLEAQLTKGEQS
jgi:hypothetical protein